MTVPLLLSLTLSMASCGELKSDPPSSQGGSVDSSEKPKISTDQNIEVEQAMVKKNILKTMNSLKSIYLEEETAKKLIRETTDRVTNEHDEVWDYVWKQVEPFAGFPTDDASLIKLVFGDNPDPDDDVEMAKKIIMGFHMGVFFNGERTFEDLNINDLKKFSYNFTIFELQENGNIKPKNQLTSSLTKDGAIIDARLFYDLEFSKDGSKFYYDMSTIHEEEAAPVTEELYQPHVLFEVTAAAQQLDKKLVQAIIDGNYIAAQKAETEEHEEIVLSIISKSTISEDRTRMTAVIDGIKYSFPLSSK